MKKLLITLTALTALTGAVLALLWGWAPQYLDECDEHATTYDLENLL